jgi:hypothetical protein
MTAMWKPVVFVLVFVVATLAADISGGWILAPAGVTSCTAACTNVGRTCNAASMKLVDTKTEFDNVNARLGNPIACSSYTTPALKYNPSINQNTGYCNFNSTLTACGSPTAVVPAAAKRFCCCQSSGCLVTNPVCFVHSVLNTRFSVSVD